MCSTRSAQVEPALGRFPPPQRTACDENVGPGKYGAPLVPASANVRKKRRDYALEEYMAKRRSANKTAGVPLNAEMRDFLASMRGPGCYDGAVNPPSPYVGCGCWTACITCASHPVLASALAPFLRVESRNHGQATKGSSLCSIRKVRHD